MYLKSLEANMRHLIDTYIEESEPRMISLFDKMGAAGDHSFYENMSTLLDKIIALRKAKAIEFN